MGASLGELFAVDQARERLAELLIGEQTEIRVERKPDGYRVVLLHGELAAQQLKLLLIDCYAAYNAGVEVVDEILVALDKEVQTRGDNRGGFTVFRVAAQYEMIVVGDGVGVEIPGFYIECAV